MGERIYGHHAIEEAIKTAGMGSTLFLVRGGGEALKKLERDALASGRIAVRKISREEIERMAPGEESRGAILDLGGPRRGVQRLVERSVEDFVSSLGEDDGALVLILDGITDPQNLGAILRSSDQFGVDLCVIPERRAAKANETVQRISSGAAEYVPLSRVTNLSRSIKTLKDAGFWIYGADMKGKRSYGFSFAKRAAIVMGSEGSGLSEGIRKATDEFIAVPMRGHIDSLNVSVATGILLYEFRRSEG